MIETSKNKNTQKKYWWLISIVLPILLALIALIPNFLGNKGKQSSADNTRPNSTQQTENVELKTNKGHNFNNVQGNINITESNDKTKKP